MSGISNTNTPTEIKAGTMEFAQALNDVLAAFKNPSDIYKKTLDEHKALQATKLEHQAILDKNDQIYAEHRASRIAFAKEQEAAEQLRNKKEKEFGEREQEIQRQQNANTARETASKSKQNELKQTEIALADREGKIKESEAALSRRESSLSSEKELVEIDKNDIRTKKEKLKEIVG